MTSLAQKGPRQPVVFETTENIQFNSCDWFETDYSHDPLDDDRKKQYYDRAHNKEYTVFAFGVRVSPENPAVGQSICVRVRNYFPYFYVLIPKEFTEDQVRDMLYAFNAYNTEDVETNQPSDEQKFFSPFMKSGINQSRVEIVEREIFWKFMNNAKFRFLKLVFKSRAAMMFYYRYLLNPVDLRIRGIREFKFNMFEADLEPCLRFFHDAEIKPSGWIECRPGTYRKAVAQSKCQINIETSFENFRPVAIDSIAPFRVASFDIEADSSHGDFPVPRKDCKKLANQLAICWLRDSFTIEKEPPGSAKRGQATLRQAQGPKFFATRIKQALGLIQSVDDEVDRIWLKSAHTDLYLSTMEAKCSSSQFATLCQDIYEICRRPLKKVKADTTMKAAAKRVDDKESELIDRQGFIEFADYIKICQQVGRSFKLDNPEDLVDKMITKETLVRFINQKLNTYLGRALGDPVIQIGTVFWEYGDPDVFHNNIITLKKASPFDVGDRPCEVVSFDYERAADSENAEAQLLLEWTALIERYDPDIIIGYNIHGFDMTYMYDRALEVIARWSRGGVPNREDIRELEKHEKFMRFLSLGRLAPDMIARCDNAKGGLTNKKLSSSALGDNFLFYFNTPGRVQIDLLKVCQSSLAKLPSYKLDDVASFFISGDIKAFKQSDRDQTTPGATATEAHKMKVTNLKEIDVGNYVVINMATTGQQLYDGEKIRVLDVDREAETLVLERPVPTNSLKNLPQWGLAKDDVSAKDIFRLQKGSDDDRMTVARYCIQDCALLIRLLKKLEVITNNVGMSNVCLIPFSYIFLRGQGIKIFSLVVKECSLAGYVLPTLEKVETDETDLGEGARPNPNSSAAGGRADDGDSPESDGTREGGGAPLGSGQDDDGDVFKLKSDFNVIKITDEGYEGAIVLPPKPGIYTEPITVLDFASLYPSEMIASDLSHDRFVEDECWLGDAGKQRLEELGYEVLDRSYDNLVWVDPRNKGKGKRPEGKTHVRFVHPKSGEKGLIPKIEMKLLAARKAAKKLMEAEENPFKKSLYEGLQLAYKLVANSLYGQIGAQTSKIYKKEIAASTTAGGRANILRGRDFCLKNNPGCEVVYGDSIPGTELVLIRTTTKDKLGQQTTQRIYYEPIEKVAYEFFGCLDYEACGKEHYVPTPNANLAGIEVYSDKGWTPVIYLMRHRTNKHLLRITLRNGSCVSTTTDHSLILETGEEIRPTELKIGDRLLTHNLWTSSSELPNDVIERLQNSSSAEYITQAGLLAHGGNQVISIEDLGETLDYVYDLETANHHFAAGLGNIVVHNTDSLFMKLNLAYEDGSYPQTDEEQIARSIEIGKWLQQKMKDEKVFKKPHDLEYEKVFKPLILASKKRYIGIKYEEDPKKGKKTSMGVVTKRRDNAPILKHTFNGVVDILTQEGDIGKAVRFVQDVCREMIDGKFDLNMFVISKTLREYYKDPESIAHKVLAMRMADRDPGNKPASNERIPYVYIKIDEKPGVEYLQGDRIEHINYVREQHLKVDFETYITNQIMKPVSQILELDIENIPGYPHRNNPAYFLNQENHYYNKFEGDLKKTAKKVSGLRQELVQKMVFQPLIDYCRQKASGVRTLESWLAANSTSATLPVVAAAASSSSDQPKPEKKSQREKPKIEASVRKYKANTLDAFLKSA
jgi:DNA polymerase elongation subunit (family B)